MGFRVSQADYLRAMWFPVAYDSGSYTLYNGQLVQWSGNGFAPMTNAGAGPDVTYYPQAVVIANNNRTPLYDSTYHEEYITSVQSGSAQALRDFFGVEGMTGKYEGQAMVKVVLLDPTTLIEGDIRNASLATAPGVVTATTGSAAGITGVVHGNADVSLLASNNMYYCRTGLNQGLVRTSYSASRTSPNFYVAWPQAVAIGDTFCVTNFGVGLQKIDLNSTSTVTGMWIENSAALTNYFTVFVEELKLGIPGNETAIFRFSRQGY
jgi:hypothetical protein